MAIPDWVGYLDRCYGDSDSEGNTDTFNRAVKELWGNFSAYATAPAAGTGEHDRDGDHMSDLTSNLWVVEEGTYTGNDADDRDISLSDAGLDIKFIRIWNGIVEFVFFRSEDMVGDASSYTNNSTFLADYIQSIATTGEFQVGVSWNTSPRVFYYVCYGVS